MEEEAYGAIRTVYPDDHIDPPLAHSLAGGVLILHLVLIAVATLLKWRELAEAREAEGAFDPSAPLLPGARYVAGTVELAQDADVAVRVAITQNGTETKGKNGWSHKWTEAERVTTALPFYLRREDGARVRVEPGREPLLVDAVDQLAWGPGTTTRIRTAELTPGEHAIVEGALTRGGDPEAQGAGAGYREQVQKGWVMRPRDGERLHISTEELAERHRIKASLYRGASYFMAAMLALSLLFGVTYFGRLMLGQPAIATVTGTRHYTTRDSKGHTHHHYVADLTVERPPSRSGHPRPPRDTDEELDSSDWVRLDRGDRLSYVHVGPMLLISTVGRGSSINAFAWIGMLITLLASLGSLAVAYFSRRWYEGTLTDTGTGRLPQPPPGSLTEPGDAQDRAVRVV